MASECIDLDTITRTPSERNRRNSCKCGSLRMHKSVTEMLIQYRDDSECFKHCGGGNPLYRSSRCGRCLPAIVFRETFIG